MVRKDSVNYLKGKLTVGYGVIGLLIGAIVYLYSSEWRQLEKLEQEVKHINVLRQKVHDAYAKKLELAMYGETILEWEAPTQCDTVPKDYNSTVYCANLSRTIRHTDWIAYGDCWKIKRVSYSTIPLTNIVDDEILVIC